MINNSILSLLIATTILSKSGGVNYFNDGTAVHKETYYNLKMNKVVETAHNHGLQGEYWIRDDGVKMFGDYVIVAANQTVHPYGSLVHTSLGIGIVLDTGEFAKDNKEQYDIAVNW